MCMVIYIAAAEPLELIPWNDSAPAFHVGKPEDKDRVVRQQFAADNTYYAGSHEGCGCGFQLEYPEYMSESDLSLHRASLHSLGAYLARQLERVDLIELFACWDGDQASKPAFRRELTPSAFDSEPFSFREKEYIRVTKDAA